MKLCFCICAGGACVHNDELLSRDFVIIKTTLHQIFSLLILPERVTVLSFISYMKGPKQKGAFSLENLKIGFFSGSERKNNEETLELVLFQKLQIN